MSETQPCLFALDQHHSLGPDIAAAMGLELTPHQEKGFEDGEHKCRSLAPVRDRDVYVIESLFSDQYLSVNDRLCRLLFFIGALKDASAARITAVMPYLCYARKERQTQARDPIISRYVAQLLETVGTDRVLTMDVHDLAAYHNAFRCPREHLEARGLIADTLATALARKNRDTVVVSPDLGGIKRAEKFRQTLAQRLGRDVGSAFLEKYRNAQAIAGANLSGAAMVGDVDGKIVVIIDDLISTGDTLVRAAQACRERGAKSVIGAVTHGLFTSDTKRLLNNPHLDQLVVTTTLPTGRRLGRPATQLTVLDVAPLLGAAIHRMHNGESIADLIED